jgi:hypothetical protein
MGLTSPCFPLLTSHEEDKKEQISGVLSGEVYSNRVNRINKSLLSIINQYYIEPRENAEFVINQSATSKPEPLSFNTSNNQIDMNNKSKRNLPHIATRLRDLNNKRNFLMFGYNDQAELKEQVKALRTEYVTYGGELLGDDDHDASEGILIDLEERYEKILKPFATLQRTEGSVSAANIRKSLQELAEGGKVTKKALQGIADSIVAFDTNYSYLTERAKNLNGNNAATLNAFARELHNIALKL